MYNIIDPGVSMCKITHDGVSMYNATDPGVKITR